MNPQQELQDDLRPEYEVSELVGGVRGKYSDQRQLPAKETGALVAAILCGALPLATGSLIYWTWYFTRDDKLPAAGLLNICLGVVLFLIGLVCLVKYVSANSKTWDNNDPAFKAKILLVGGLLFVNFPLAGIYLTSAISRMGDCVVEIFNDTDTPIDRFVLRAPGVDIDAGPIQPGERSREFVAFQGDGSFTFAAKQRELEFKGELSGYVTHSQGGQMSVHVLPGGEFNVIDNSFVD